MNRFKDASYANLQVKSIIRVGKHGIAKQTSSTEMIVTGPSLAGLSGLSLIAFFDGRTMVLLLC